MPQANSMAHLVEQPLLRTLGWMTLPFFRGIKPPPGRLGTGGLRLRVNLGPFFDELLGLLLHARL